LELVICDLATLSSSRLELVICYLELGACYLLFVIWSF